MMDKNLMEQFTYQIGLGEDEQRLDKWISAALPDLSRSYIQKCIKEQNVLVNQKPQKASYRLKVDDEIVFDIPKAMEPAIEAENLPLAILYEDEDILILNKPAGALSQKAKKEDVSLNEWMIGYLLKKEEITGEELSRFCPSVCKIGRAHV